MASAPYTPYGVQQQAQQAQQSQQGQPNPNAQQPQQGQQLSPAHANIVNSVAQNFAQGLATELQSRQQQLAQAYRAPVVDIPGQPVQQPQQSAMDAAMQQVSQFLQQMGHTPDSFFGNQTQDTAQQQGQ